MSRVDVRLATGLAAALLLAPAVAPAQGSSGPIATLMVQVTVADDGITVIESLRGVGGAGPVNWTVPLLAPEVGEGPTMAPRTDANPRGIEANPGPGLRTSFEGDRLIVTGTPASRDFQVQVRYQVPIGAGRMVLSATPAMNLARVQIVTRRGKTYTPQIRPLAPYAFEEEAESDGTWQYLTLVEPVKAGAPVRIALGHLPAPFGPYRAAGIAVCGISLLGLALAVRKRKAG